MPTKRDFRDIMDLELLLGPGRLDSHCVDRRDDGKRPPQAQPSSQDGEILAVYILNRSTGEITSRPPYTPDQKQDT